MMEYKIITDGSERALEDQVNEYLKRGWKLQGGISAVLEQTPGGFFKNTFVQALVS